MSLVRFRSEAPYAAVAHLVERHLAKVEVASSSLVGRSMGVASVTPYFGPVAQLVRAPACHAGGRRFEPDPGRQHPTPSRGILRRMDAGTNASLCGRSSSGRAPPCQGGGSEFEPRRPLQTGAFTALYTVAWPSGKAKVCKTFIHQFKSGRHLQKALVLCTGAFFACRKPACSFAPPAKQAAFCVGSSPFLAHWAVQCYNRPRKEACLCQKPKTEPP